MIWFIVPAHGRLALSELCLGQLMLVCEDLGAEALVVAEDWNLDIAHQYGFETLERPNSDGLGKRFNDGFEHAAQNGADCVVPLGSDDWVHADLFQELPDERTVACFRSGSLVREDGRRLAKVKLPPPPTYEGGFGIRIMPCELLRFVGYRPAEDERRRVVDASIVQGLRRASDLRMREGLPDVILEYRESDPLSIVDFKTRGENVTTYEMCADYIQSESQSPFEELAQRYPSQAVEAMAEHYGVHA